MYARGISFGNPSDCTVNYVEPLVWIVFIQTHFEILRAVVVCKAHCVPLDIKDAVGRCTGDRGENAATVRPRRATAQACIGHQVMPQGEDREVIRAPIDWGGQTAGDVTVRLIRAHKVQAPIGIDVHAIEGLTI